MDREMLQSRSFQKFNIREIAKHMPRDRHQDGWVEEVGKHVKKWKGHWYEYYVNEAGQKKRRHRACLTFLRASLDEAVELGFLLVNPARKLRLPKTRATCTRFLSSQEFQTLLRVFEKRDRIIFRLFLLCALRQGELFALRWADKVPGKLRISRAVYRGRVGTTKTKTSTGFVALPPSLDQELEFFRKQCGTADLEDYIFSSRTGTPLDGHITCADSWLPRPSSMASKA